MKRTALFLMAAIALLAGCRTISVDDEASSFAGAITRGLRDTITNAQSRKALSDLIDTLVAHAGNTAGKQGLLLRDSLLNDRTRDWLLALEHSLADDLQGRTGKLRDDLLGKRTLDLVAALRSELLGPRTQQQLGAIRNDLLGLRTQALLTGIRDSVLGDQTMAYVERLRDNLLGDSTRVRLAAIREELIGAGTRGSIDSIVAGSIRRIQQASGEEQGRLKGNISGILWTAGGILAGLLVLGGVVYLIGRSRRYQKMVEMMTLQINKIPDRQVYDELTSRIHDKSLELGLEPSLRTVLKKQGLVEG